MIKPETISPNPSIRDAFWHCLPNCCNLLGDESCLACHHSAFCMLSQGLLAFGGICYAALVVLQLILVLEWQLVVKWEGTLRLDEVANKKLMLYLFDLFLVVQLFRWVFAKDLEVNGVWSRFRIFINLLAQIHPWAFTRCFALIDRCWSWLGLRRNRCRSWIRRRLRMRRVA